MSWTPREIGTLIVVILKARHLPNKRHIGKQDPYCVVAYNGEKRRTKAIKRGGQHPEWDEEVRFTLFEDLEDHVARTANGPDGPPVPPKDSKAKIKGGKKMLLSCFADDPREPELVGETSVDLTEVLTKGETDEWFTLTHKERYCGDVYLELTFWSNEPEPEKMQKPTVAKPGKQYGGAGSFIPAGSMPSTMSAGPGGRHNPSRHASTGHMQNNPHSSVLPPSLRASSSMATLDLYVAPYETPAQSFPQGPSPVDQIVGDFAQLDVQSHRHRAESFPGPHGGTYTPRAPSPGFYGHHPASYQPPPSHGPSYHDNASIYGYDQPVTPTATGYSHYEPQNYYPGLAPQPSGISRAGTHRSPRHSLPTTSSGFVPLSNPAPSGFMPPEGGGFTSPMSATLSYAQGYAATSAPSEFSYLSGPIHAGSYDSPLSYQHPQSSFQHPAYPHPPASAPPQAMPFPPPTPLGVPSPSHSAPPQGYHEPLSVPPPPPIPPTPTPSMPNSGSRPLPQPQLGSGQASPHRQSSLPPPPNGGISVQNSYSLPNPPPPPPMPPNFTGTPVPAPPLSAYNTGGSYGANGFIPPPPPPPVSQFQAPMSAARPNLPQPGYSSVPPPPPLASHMPGQSQYPGPLPRPPTAGGWAPPPQMASGYSY